MATSLPVATSLLLGGALLVPGTAFTGFSGFPGLGSSDGAPARAHSTVSAAEAPTCPAHELTADQLNPLLDQIEVATAAKAAKSYRLVLTSDAAGLRMTVTKDAVHKRWEQTIGDQESVSIRIRALENGYAYLVATKKTSKKDKAALAVLHRGGVWINVGKADTDTDDVLTGDGGDATGPGTCTALDDGGVRLTFPQEKQKLILRTDASGAIVKIVGEDDDDRLVMGVNYGRHTVPTIPASKRIKEKVWIAANEAAEMRADLRTWASKVSAKAKAAAEEADRKVRVSDVRKAGRAIAVSRSLRSITASGMRAVKKDHDPYTSKQLRVEVNVTRGGKVKISDNW